MTINPWSTPAMGASTVVIRYDSHCPWMADTSMFLALTIASIHGEWPSAPMNTVCLAGVRGLMFDACNAGFTPVTISTSPLNSSATICTTLKSLASYATSAATLSFTSAKDPAVGVSDTCGSAAAPTAHSIHTAASPHKRILCRMSNPPGHAGVAPAIVGEPRRKRSVIRRGMTAK